MKEHPIGNVFIRDGLTAYSIDVKRPSRQEEEQIAAFIAAGKVTRCPTVHLVSSQHPDEIKKEAVPEAKAQRPRGGGWARYWEKRRQQLGAKL